MNDDKLLENICRKFRIDGDFTGYSIITIGNINTTYRVEFVCGGSKKYYILQKVNTYVFKNPELIMSNIDLVTTHIANRDPSARRIHFHHTYDKKNYYQTEDGSFWRLCNYIDSITFDTCADLSVLKGVGRAFGEFQTKLSDFDASSLYETIPDFHNTRKRIERLLDDAERDECGRAGQVKDEIAFVREMRGRASLLTDMLEKGELPLRVTHNDTKANNVLFDRETMTPIAVVDLDTVMPGLAMHDFGDAVRSAANTSDEDEPDLSKVSLDLERYRAFTEGFIGAISGSLTENEIGTMALGAFTIAIELGTRFLDDYLTGDKYFKTDYEGHNLVRSRCQFELARDMLRKSDDMNAIVRDVASI